MPERCSSVSEIKIDRFLGQLGLAARKVKVKRSFRRSAFFNDLVQSGRSVALNAKQSFSGGNRASAGVSFTGHVVKYHASLDSTMAIAIIW